MVMSRLQTVAAHHGAVLRRVADGTDLGGLGLLLVDLSRDADQQLVRLQALTAGNDPPPVVVFGPHLLMRDLGPRARQAGAGRVVANSAVQGVLARLLEHEDGLQRTPKELP